VAKGEANLLVKIQTAGEQALESVKSKLAAIGAIGVAAFAALSAVIVKAIGEAHEQERATNELTQSMINNGIYSANLAKEYKNQADAIAELTLFKGEDVTAAQASLQSYLGQTKVTKELTMAVADLATRKKMDLVSAAEMVGKSIGTETNMLGRQGIEIDTTASKTQKMSQAIAGLNNLMGGQAIAATDGLGAIQKLKNVMDDAFQAIGERLAPSVVILINHLITMVKGFTQSNTIMSMFVTVLNTVIQTGAILSGVIGALGSLIGTSFATSLSTISSILDGNFKQAFATAKGGVIDMGKTIVDSYTTTTNLLDSLSKSQTASQQAELLKQEENVKASNLRKNDVARKTEDEDFNAKIQRTIERQDYMTSLVGANQEQIIQAEIAHHEKLLNIATSAGEKRKEYEIILNQKRLLNAQAHKKAEEALEMASANAKVNIVQSTAGLITAATADGSKAAFVAQKAAALASAYVSMNQAAVAALATPPAPNFGLQTMAYVAGGLNIAAIAATAIKGLETGGIVPATPGGQTYRLGEGGQSEAVIPLDKMSGMGGGVTINVYGGMLGDQSTAREFAIAVDRQLLELRRNNESVAFDGRVV
jgi:hypothetical protein